MAPLDRVKALYRAAAGPVRAAYLHVTDLYIVRFLKETFRRFTEDESAVLAGYIAYASMLATFPFLIFAMTLVGSIIGKGYSEQAIAALFGAVPEHVAKTLEPVLHEVIGERRGGILTLSAIGTLYGASNGVEAIRIGLDRAYDIPKKRNFFVNRVIAVGFVMLGFVTFALLAVLIIFAPLVFNVIELVTTVRIPASADIARYGIGSVLLFLVLWMMHRFLPARPMHWKRLWPGVLVTLVLWVLLATAMSIYVANSPTYALTYGALAGVVVTLLFFYLTGVSIIFGAQVNATLNFGVPPPRGEAGRERAWADDDGSPFDDDEDEDKARAAAAKEDGQ